jgi:3-hydroxybutyryl-CoA dehydratase
MLDIGQYYIEDLEKGMRAEIERTVTSEYVDKFADVSGDKNPLHLDEDYARETMFKGRIAHGMLSASFISTIFGTMMPGRGSIYLQQNLKFTAPVRHGDTVRAVVEVQEVVPEKKRVNFTTQCFVGDTMVIDGSATIMVPSRS